MKVSSILKFARENYQTNTVASIKADIKERKPIGIPYCHFSLIERHIEKPHPNFFLHFFLRKNLTEKVSKPYLSFAHGNHKILAQNCLSIENILIAVAIEDPYEWSCFESKFEVVHEHDKEKYRIDDQGNLYTICPWNRQRNDIIFDK